MNTTLNGAVYGTKFDLMSIAVAWAAPGATSAISADLASAGITGSANTVLTRTLVSAAGDFVSGRDPDALRSLLSGIQIAGANEIATQMANYGSDVNRAPTSTEVNAANLAVGAAKLIVESNQTQGPSNAQASAPASSPGGSAPQINVAAADAYLAANPDVAAVVGQDWAIATAANYFGVDPGSVNIEMVAVAHYQLYGKNEGRTFGNEQTAAAPVAPVVAVLSPADQYLKDNPDIAAICTNSDILAWAAGLLGISTADVTPQDVALVHYQRFGQNEGRNWAGSGN